MTTRRLTLLAALGLGITALFGPGCPSTPLPGNYVEMLFEGDPETRCAQWIDTVTDVYMKKMECSAADEHLAIDDREVKYHSQKYHPVTVRWYGDPPGSVLRIRAYGRSLEALLAPLVGAEATFVNPETGDYLDLFGRDLIGELIMGDPQVKSDPPIVLTAFDIAAGAAKREYAEKRKAFPLTDSESSNPEVAKLDHAGPVQTALLPVARLLAEKCQGQMLTAQVVAQLAVSPSCTRALTMDPFLAALFGNARVGEAVTIRAQQQAAEAHHSWIDNILPPPVPLPPKPPGGAGAGH